MKYKHLVLSKDSVLVLCNVHKFNLFSLNIGITGHENSARPIARTTDFVCRKKKYFEFCHAFFLFFYHIM